jgi:radical SAM superfamily enzyme YgiQ (UPF0313 family)
MRGNSMKVLLLNPPASKLYLRDQYCSFTSKANYYWPPIDLLVQSGIMATKHQVNVIDAVIDRLSIDECMEEIFELAPDLILCVTGISSFIYDFAFMEAIKGRLSTLIFLSGGFLLSEYKSILNKYNYIDGVLLDFSSNALLNYLDGEAFIKNLAYRRDGQVFAERSHSNEIQYPIPKHELFKLAKYRLPHGKSKLFSCMITNFGCPYTCEFCVAQNLNYKCRPYSDVLKEMIYLKSIGIEEVFIKDFTFGVNKNYTLQLCAEIKDKVKMSWICASRVDLVDDELLCAMKNAGCHTIQFGVETPNEDLLKKYKGGLRIETIISTFALCRKYRLKTLGHFILGLPGDTKESINKTIRFAKQIKCDYASFNIATPLPGTVLRDECKDRSWLNHNISELDLSSGESVINTELLSGAILEKLKKKAYRSFYFRPNYILKKLIQIKSFIELITLIREGLGIINKNI